MPLAVMLASVAANLERGQSVIAHVVESALSPATKARVERSLPRGTMTLNWISVDRDRMAVVVGTLRRENWLTIATFYRLLLGELLPAELNKVIYLDCDLVLTRCLGTLWQTDLGDHYLAAVQEPDPDGGHMSSKRGLPLYRELGLPAGMKLFNAGVLVINLQKWRQEMLAARVVAYLRAAGERALWQDQDGLNAIIAGDWKELDARWNVTMHLYLDPSRVANCEMLLSDPYIVHFNTAVKPWHSHFRYGFQDLFLHYLDQTDWAGWRPEPPPLSAVEHRSAAIAVRAFAKRRETAARFLTRSWRSLEVRRNMRSLARTLDRRSVPEPMASEIRAFVVLPSPQPQLPALFADLVARGVGRLLVAGSEEALAPLRQWQAETLPVHRFVLDAHQPTPHQVLRHLLERYGSGCWCLLPETDAVLVPPHADRATFADVCSYLDRHGFESMSFRRPRAGRVRALRTVRMFARDPLSDAVFSADIEIDPTDIAEEAGNGRTKLALLKYRTGLRFAEDFGAAADLRAADIRGAIVPVAPEWVSADAQAGGEQDRGEFPEASWLAARAQVATSSAFDAFLGIGREGDRLAREGKDRI